MLGALDGLSLLGTCGVGGRESFSSTMKDGLDARVGFEDEEELLGGGVCKLVLSSIST